LDLRVKELKQCSTSFFCTKMAVTSLWLEETYEEKKKKKSDSVVVWGHVIVFYH